MLLIVTSRFSFEFGQFVAAALHRVECREDKLFAICTSFSHGTQSCWGLSASLPTVDVTSQHDLRRSSRYRGAHDRCRCLGVPRIRTHCVQNPGALPAHAGMAKNAVSLLCGDYELRSVLAKRLSENFGPSVTVGEENNCLSIGRTSQWLIPAFDQSEPRQERYTCPV